MQPLITYGPAHPSIGVWLGPLLALTLIALLAFGARQAYWYANSAQRMDEVGLGRWLGRLCLASIIVVVLGTAYALYPYSDQYHEWRHISGTVSSTNSRFLAGDHGTNQKFVITFAGSDQQFGCNDTRCATVREGDDLTITCKRSFQWFGTPGYDCNFVSMKAARR